MKLTKKPNVPDIMQPLDMILNCIGIKTVYTNKYVMCNPIEVVFEDGSSFVFDKTDIFRNRNLRKIISGNHLYIHMYPVLYPEKGQPRDLYEVIYHKNDSVYKKICFEFYKHDNSIVLTYIDYYNKDESDVHYIYTYEYITNVYRSSHWILRNEQKYNNNSHFSSKFADYAKGVSYMCYDNSLFETLEVKTDNCSVEEENRKRCTLCCLNRFSKKILDYTNSIDSSHNKHSENKYFISDILNYEFTSNIIKDVCSKFELVYNIDEKEIIPNNLFKLFSDTKTSYPRLDRIFTDLEANDLKGNSRVRK